MKKTILLLLLPFQLLAQSGHQHQALLSVIQSFAETSAVTGREQEAAAYIKALFEKGICKEDRLGNLELTIGSADHDQDTEVLDGVRQCAGRAPRACVRDDGHVLEVASWREARGDGGGGPNGCVGYMTACAK